MSGNTEILSIEDFFSEIELARVAFTLGASEIARMQSGGPQTVVVCFHAVSIARLSQHHKCGLPTLLMDYQNTNCWGHNE